MKKIRRSLVYKNWPFVVVGCLIEKNGKFLLVQEVLKEKGKWNQSVGWLNKGENPIQGAKRETEEETGFKIKITHFLGVYSMLRKRIRGTPKERPVDRHPVKLIFIGRIVGKKNKIRTPASVGNLVFGKEEDYIPKINKEEISAIKWFKPKEIFAMDKKTLRDLDIKDEVKDYLAGRKYPLKLVKHRIAR